MLQQEAQTLQALVNTIVLGMAPYEWTLHPPPARRTENKTGQTNTAKVFKEKRKT